MTGRDEKGRATRGVPQPPARPMGDAAFAELAAIHGGRLADWPSALRPRAEATLAISSAARAALVDARALDDALDGLAGEPATDALTARILADAAAESALRAAPAPRPAPRPAGARRRPMLGLAGLFLRPAAFAASAVAGVLIGYAAPGVMTDSLAYALQDAAASQGIDQSFLAADLLPEIAPALDGSN